MIAGTSRVGKEATGSQCPSVPRPCIGSGSAGATCILLRADLHRHGAVFPAFVLGHAIEWEWEGLAQLALRMGVRPYGRTDVRIWHA